MKDLDFYDEAWAVESQGEDEMGFTEPIYDATMDSSLEKVLKALEPFALLSNSPDVWAAVVAEVTKANSVVEVSLSSRRVLEKAKFASRSEAARFAAEQRWKNNPKKTTGAAKQPATTAKPDANEAKADKLHRQILDLERRIAQMRMATRKTDRMMVALEQRKRQLARAMSWYESLTGHPFRTPVTMPFTEGASNSATASTDEPSSVAAFDSLSEKQLSTLVAQGVKFPKGPAAKDDIWKTVATDDEGNEWMLTPFTAVRLDQIPFGKKPKFVSYEDANPKAQDRLSPEDMKTRRTEQTRTLKGIAGKPGQQSVMMETLYSKTIDNAKGSSQEDRVIARLEDGRRFSIKASAVAVMVGKTGSARSTTFKFLPLESGRGGTLIAYNGDKMVGMTMSTPDEDAEFLAQQDSINGA